MASKNFLFLGNLGLHGGVNYSLETDDDDTDPNLFLGIDKTIGDVVFVHGEYDFGWNDNDNWTEQTLQQNIDILNRGYLNSTLGIHLSETLSVQVSFLICCKNAPTPLAATAPFPSSISRHFSSVYPSGCKKRLPHS